MDPYLCRVTYVRSRFSFRRRRCWCCRSPLCEEPSQWRHGYALAGQTGLKSVALYPSLTPLADRGLVGGVLAGGAGARPAAAAPVPAGTAAGLASASGALASPAEALGSAARPTARAGARAARTGRNVVTPVVL